MRVVVRNCLEPVIQIGLELGEGGIVDSKYVLHAGEKDGGVNSVKGKRPRSVRSETFPASEARSKSFTM